MGRPNESSVLVDCSSVLHEPTLRRKPTSTKQGEPKAEPGPRTAGQPPPAGIARRLPVVLEWTIVVSPQMKPSREVPSRGPLQILSHSSD